MLPERFIREFWGCWPPVAPPVSDRLAFGCNFSGLPQNYQPHTLTGDEWRAAMDAMDQATDVALDAIY